MFLFLILALVVCSLLYSLCIVFIIFVQSFKVCVIVSASTPLPSYPFVFTIILLTRSLVLDTPMIILHTQTPLHTQQH